MPRQRRTALRAIDSSFRPVLALMSGRTVGFAASFLIPVALARILDQAEFGTYKQLFLIAATLYGMGQLGMAESLFYFLPRAESRDGSRYVANSIAALAVGGLLCFALLSLEGGLVARWLGNPALAGYTAPLGIYLGLMIASAGLEIVMIARKRYPLASWAYAALDVTRAGLLVLPAFLIPGLSGLLTGAIVFAAVRCSVAAWYLSREFHEDRVRPDAALFRAQLAYAMPFALAGLVEIAQTSFHQYFVAYRTDPASFAVYAVGCLQIPLVEVATASVLNVMMVRMSEHLGAGRDGTAVDVWHDSTRKLALLFLPMVGFLVVAAHPIITFLFTERYAASVPVFVVSTLGLLLPVIAVDAVLRVRAETRVLFGLNVLRLLLTVILIGPFIGRFGLAGAVLATVAAAAVAKAVGLARIARSLRLTLSDLLPWSSLARIALAALAAATAAGIAELETDVPVAALLVGGVVFGAVYLAALWALGALSASERASIRALIGRVRLVRAARPEA
jgi:O-antigen/teichoic acid export membrane protein